MTEHAPAAGIIADIAGWSGRAQVTRL